METLKIKNAMAQAATDLTKEILDFLTILIPYASVVTIFWRIIDAILSYANAGRDARTKELIHEANAPLKDDIGKLTESIWALKDEIKKMK